MGGAPRRGPALGMTARRSSVQRLPRAPAHGERGRDPPPPGAAAVIELAGGVDAPARACRWALSRLGPMLAGTSGEDVALVVSELVTNSVVHAHVDATQRVRIALAQGGDRVRITVTDPGGYGEPHFRDVDPGTSGGRGLRLVHRLCTRWGVACDTGGASQVWCELPLGGA